MTNLQEKSSRRKFLLSSSSVTKCRRKPVVGCRSCERVCDVIHGKETCSMRRSENIEEHDTTVHRQHKT